MHVNLAQFESRWRPVLAAVYSGEPATAWPFVDRSWSALPLGFSPCLQPAEFALLDPILGPTCSGAILISQPDVGSDREAPIELPWTNLSLTNELADTVFPHFEEFRITPISGAWAWCCSNEELSVLGGPESLLQRLIEALGGEVAARESFFSSVTRWVSREFVASIAKHRNWDAFVAGCCPTSGCS